MEQYHYKGHGVIVERNGRGFRSMIRPPNGEKPIPGPSCDGQAKKKDLLMRVKNLIDLIDQMAGEASAH
jgi:hypothetical protein